jgi:CheY-like chemotaxis protein
VGVGTGLGLSICHNIVTAMGGEIAVDSEPSRGTTFRITLPASSGALSAPLQRQQREASGSGAEVLIVDDEPRLAAVLARLLDDHRLTAVTNARQAIELIEQGHNFDLILSDLMMPEMSGMEFYEYLARAHPRLLSRVVFLTGGAFTPAAKAFLDRVDNVRLEKPFGPAELRALVKDALVKSRRVRPVENGKQEA